MRSAYITGNLGADPVLFSPQNSEWACLTFNIANSDMSKKNQQGGYDNVTQWFTVKFWTKKPQDWLQKLMKGTSVIVETEIETESWEKDGENHYKMVFKIKAGSFPYIQNRSNNNVQNNTPKKQPESVPAQSGPPTFKDDIPF